jgi:hypothetical protein
MDFHRAAGVRPSLTIPRTPGRRRTDTVGADARSTEIARIVPGELPYRHVVVVLDEPLGREPTMDRRGMG